MIAVGRDNDEYEAKPHVMAYVLWAKEFFTASADAISTGLVFLKTGATKPSAFFEEQLHEVLELIPREYAVISCEYGDFRSSQRESLSCTFAEVCPEYEVARK